MLEPPALQSNTGGSNVLNRRLSVNSSGYATDSVEIQNVLNRRLSVNSSRGFFYAPQDVEFYRRHPAAQINFPFVLGLQPKYPLRLIWRGSIIKWFEQIK